MIIPLLVGFQIVGSYTMYVLLRINYQNLEKRVASLEETRSHPAPPLGQLILHKIPYELSNKDIYADTHRPEYRELL
jgi:hypothetical protein